MSCLWLQDGKIQLWKPCLLLWATCQTLVYYYLLESGSCFPVSRISLYWDVRLHNPGYYESPFIEFFRFVEEFWVDMLPIRILRSLRESSSKESLAAVCLKLLMLFSSKVYARNIPDTRPFISTLKIFERWSGSASSPRPPTPISVFLPKLFFHSRKRGQEKKIILSIWRRLRIRTMLFHLCEQASSNTHLHPGVTAKPEHTHKSQRNAGIPLHIHRGNPCPFNVWSKKSFHNCSSTCLRCYIFIHFGACWCWSPLGVRASISGS